MKLAIISERQAGNAYTPREIQSHYFNFGLISKMN